MPRVVATWHVVLHVAELCLQMECAILYYYSRPLVFLVLSGVVLLSLVVTNTVSYVWVYRAVDFSHRPCARCVCALLHLLQLGQVWRYFKYVLVYDISDYDELIFLRMVHAGLQSVPYFMVQSYVALSSRELQPITAVSLAVAALSIVAVYASFVEGNAREVHKELTLGTSHVTKIVVEPIQRRGRWDLMLLQLVYRAGCISARLCALAVSAAALRAWLCAPLAAHWLSTVLWYARGRGGLDCAGWARLGVVAYAQLVDLVNIAENERTVVVCVYYLLMVCENSVLTVLALLRMRVLAAGPHKLAILATVYAGFLTGLSALLLHQRCLQRRRGHARNHRPPRHADVTRDAEQLIARKQDPGQAETALQQPTPNPQTENTSLLSSAAQRRVMELRRDSLTTSESERSRDDVSRDDVSRGGESRDDEGQWTTCSDNDSYMDTCPVSKPHSASSRKPPPHQH